MTDLINYLKSNNIELLIVNQGGLTSLIPLIKNELPKIKIIAWQHSSYEVYINNYYKYILDSYLNGLKKADLVVCLTKSDQKKFIKINENTHQIYNPLTIDNKGEICNVNKKNIIFVGRLEMETKGLDFLVDIANALNKDWKILVAGDGSDKDKFKKMLIKNNLVDRVILKGALNNDKLRELYTQGSIFISTSRWEGFGLAIIEAMSFGLPIVSFANSGPIEILENGKYGKLISKDDVGEFICSLNMLIKNSNERLKMQRKSISRSQDFKMSSIIKEWDNNLKSLIHNNKTPLFNLERKDV